MPKVEAYRRLAPFGARELVDSANALLIGRDRLRLSERTLRYYISQKVLPPPEGPPKIARYSFEHLVGLIAIRGLQDRGVSLDRIRDELAPLWTGDERALAATLGVLEYWLESDRGAISEESIVAAFQPFLVQEPRATYAPTPAPSPQSYARRRPSAEDETLDDLRDLTAQVSQLREEITHLSGGSSEYAAEPFDADLAADSWRLLQTMEEERERTRAGFEEIRRSVADLAMAVRELSGQVMELRAQLETDEKSDTPDSD